MTAYDFLKKRDTCRTYNGNPAATLGAQLKTQSDDVMEMTWWNDPQSKIAYIYDYYHDDQPELNQGMTYENTTKTPIDIKFIVKEYGSITKDQVSFHIIFRPSRKTAIDENDEIDYFYQDYFKKYGVKFPVSLYIDIPDEEGVYHKWIIVDMEKGNQFRKYNVLPCDYQLHWIEIDGNKRIKRNIWCCARAMNSYTSGLWVDRYFSMPDDVSKLWLPINPITERLGYKHSNGQNQRVIVDILTAEPNTWKISKIERTKPIGIVKITLDQDQFNSHTDYVNFETGEMYADYYSSEVKPINIDNPIYADKNCKLTAVTDTIRVGGSYKLITANVFADDGRDITDLYLDKFSPECWTCYIDKTDMTHDSHITWLPQADNNKMKIKFADDSSYFNKVLTVKCNIDGNIGAIRLELTA